MNRINWLEIAERGFLLSNSKQLHVSDLAKHLINERLVSAFTIDDLVNKLASALSGNVKRKNSKFSKVKNTKGGYKRGVYKIKNTSPTQLIRNDAPEVDTLFTGKAGEHAVLSELLFRGYNASIMVVDHGIDVVANKNNKYFHIQVKTANGDDSKPYTATIKKESFQHASDIFYIIVLRRAQKQRYINDFAILSSSEIRRYITNKTLKEGSTIQLRITVDNNKFTLNGSTDITNCINDFDIIL